REAGAEYRRLHLVEARVHAELGVVVAIGLAAVTQAFGQTRSGRIADGQRAAVAERAEVLGRVEAVGRGRTEAADRTPGAGGQVRLATVFDDREAVTLGDREDRRHVGRLPVEMHRHDRGGARRDR